MKKLLSFTLALCLCLCYAFVLISCNGEDKEIEESENQTVNTEKINAETTETPTLNAESDNIKESETTLLPSFDSESEISQLSFRDYSEFKEFIDSTDKLPSDFVYYEDISYLGAFKSIVFLSVAICDDY